MTLICAFIFSTEILSQQCFEIRFWIQKVEKALSIQVFVQILHLVEGMMDCKMLLTSSSLRKGIRVH